MSVNKEDTLDVSLQAHDVLNEKFDPSKILGRYVMVASRSIKWWKHDALIKAINKLSDAGFTVSQMTSMGKHAGAGNVIFVLMEKKR